MSAVMGLLAEARTPASPQPYAVVAALALAGLVARAAVALIRALFALLVVALGALILFSGLIAVLTTLVDRY
jgi:hypothetical protein